MALVESFGISRLKDAPITGTDPNTREIHDRYIAHLRVTDRIFGALAVAQVAKEAMDAPIEVVSAWDIPEGGEKLPHGATVVRFSLTDTRPYQDYQSSQIDRMIDGVQSKRQPSDHDWSRVFGIITDFKETFSATLHGMPPVPYGFEEL